MRGFLHFLAFTVAVSLSAMGGGYLWWNTQTHASFRLPSQSPPLTSVNKTTPAGKLQILSKVDHEFTELVGRVMPSVVSITAVQQAAVLNDSFSKFFGVTALVELPPQLGSGVIVSQEGHIVTNLHVIGGSLVVRVHLNDGKILSAKVLGTDPFTDLAILKVKGTGFTPLELGNSDEVRVGQAVIAVGNPYGLQETVTQGIISAKGRRGFSETVNEFFQTDAAINPGNSGGPLIDSDGKIIAINNSILSDRGGWQGISFAIPSNTVKRVFNDIRTHGHVVHTWLGVLTAPLTASLSESLGILPGRRGVFIYRVFQDSPARRAGIRPGDIIIGFGGKNVYDGIGLKNRVAETLVGQKVSIKILRDRSEKQVEVTIEKSPRT
ncbi:Putative serine protease HhoB precursor [Candidatus Xiphinematobacter sp. Idaho Grape]|uniref:S1C family serine protease n=1 Tax=Candidatus Xiphinematobacter sp. Idaho Grape TaxID=1704307 RepID=UPI000705DE0D|nr:trypsin-like peptidase domain-containing protein [Candidatus Xiphinematobacter sp. Idaho Grape]ALJ56460.1 Putative serine protease HhoB precursor [Candidatus Xiphinematobacter sp. Idaho Grape]